jgi:hypothetical protein
LYKRNKNRKKDFKINDKRFFQSSHQFEQEAEVSEAVENIRDTVASLEDKLRSTTDDCDAKIEEQVSSTNGVFEWISGADFSYIFSGENFGENSAENCPPKMLGKNGIFRGKSFEKIFFFREIPRNLPRKNTFRGKKCMKNRPLVKIRKREQIF